MVSWFLPQGSAKTKDDAEQAFKDTSVLNNEVDAMMDQLSAAEQELERKKAEAERDMMMAGMVRPAHLSKPRPQVKPVQPVHPNPLRRPTGVRQRQGGRGQRPQGQERCQDGS